MRVGLPHIKRRKLHFKSIELFPYCVIKYFLPIINRILSEENDDYGGLRNVLVKFQDIIYQKMKDHPVLGKKVDPNQFEFNSGVSQYSEFVRYTFNIDQSGNMGENSMSSSFSQEQTRVNEYIQEVNDYITNSLYKELFAYPKRMSREQAEFQSVQEQMLQEAKPETFDIPPEWLNPQNSQFWNKAIRELRKVDKQTTPRAKLQYLLNSIVVFNQSFTLFTSVGENEACADDLVRIFPYLLLKAKINRLYQNMK